MSPIDVMELAKVYEGITYSNCVSTDTLQNYGRELENQMEKELMMQIGAIAHNMEQNQEQLKKALENELEKELVIARSVADEVKAKDEVMQTYVQVMQTYITKCERAWCIG